MRQTNITEADYMPRVKNTVISVFSSSNSAIISVAKSILDDSKVKYSVNKNDTRPETKKTEDNIIEIFVEEKDFKTAKKLLGDLEELDFEQNF